MQKKWERCLIFFTDLDVSPFKVKGPMTQISSVKSWTPCKMFDLEM